MVNPALHVFCRMWSKQEMFLRKNLEKTHSDPPPKKGYIFAIP